MTQNLSGKSVLIHGLTIRNPFVNYLLRERRRSSPYIPPPLPKTPNGILISNISNLGDVVIATTVIPALRQQYPNCRIGFLTSSRARSAIEIHPDIDAIHIFDHAYQSQAELGKCKAVLQHMRLFKRVVSEIQGRYEIAIDLQPFFPNAARLLSKAKIPYRIGYSSGGFAHLFTHPLKWEWSNEYLCSSHLHLLRAAGIVFKGVPPVPNYPKVPIPSSVSIPKSYICLAPNSSKKEKEWLESSWEILARKLRQHGHEIVLVGKGDRNTTLCSKLENRLKCVNLHNRLNWPEFIGVLQGSKLLISVDSVAIHVAAGADVSTIAIHSGINNCTSWMPEKSNFLIASNPTSCSPCYKKNGCKSMKCIFQIAPSSILNLANALLVRASKQSPNALAWESVGTK